MEYKDALLEFYRTHTRMPSYSEAAAVFGVASKDSAYRIIKTLIKDGVVKKDSKGKIVPSTIPSGGIKMLGVVEAGFPTPAEENLLDTVTLDTFMIDRRESSFMLRVKGDSMIDAGIHEGDFVIVDRSSEAKSGDIVIAEIDGQWTMKYLRKEGKMLYLQAGNKAYKDMVPVQSLSVAAVVVGVVRKYA